MPPPDETDPSLVGPEPIPPIDAGAAEAERRIVTRRSLTKHEKELNAHELKLKDLEVEEKRARIDLLKQQTTSDAAEKAARTVLLTRQDKVLEQEVSRLWWDKYTRIVACAMIFGIVGMWLWAVRQLLVLPADKRPTDAVLIAALGTTTVNVLGLLYIVARYLFPQQKRAESLDAASKTD